MWVYSNLDKIELFLNGQSLGAKQMTKDSHLAWTVKYAPGTIEARGYKGDKQVLTARRATTGQAAILVMKIDRKEILADGEDVAMVAVEVQDSEGRVVPVANNEVAFRVSGDGKLIGVGNGDPTSHESDKGTSRSAFCGLCMAIVQSTKTPGLIKVEATSSGLASASATVAKRHNLAPPGGGLGTRRAPGARHYRVVEASPQSRGRKRSARDAPGRRFYRFHFPTRREQSQRNRRGHGRRVLWRQRRSSPDRGRQGGGQRHLLQGRQHDVFGNAQRRRDRASEED